MNQQQIERISRLITEDSSVRLYDDLHDVLRKNVDPRTAFANNFDEGYKLPDDGTYPLLGFLEINNHLIELYSEFSDDEDPEMNMYIDGHKILEGRSTVANQSHFPLVREVYSSMILVYYQFSWHGYYDVNYALNTRDFKDVVGSLITLVLENIY